MMALALGLSFSAFATLSLAMEKHQQGLYGKAAASPARRRLWRGLGWAVLALGTGLCVRAHGWALGPVIWLGALTAAGLVLALALHPYRPRWVVPLAWTLPLAGRLVALC